LTGTTGFLGGAKRAIDSSSKESITLPPCSSGLGYKTADLGLVGVFLGGVTGFLGGGAKRDMYSGHSQISARQSLSSLTPPGTSRQDLLQ